MEGGGGQRSLLIRATAVQTVDQEDKIRPGRHRRVPRSHHLKAQVVKGPDEGP